MSLVNENLKKRLLCNYCDTCIDDVKSNLAKLHYWNLFSWGNKGDVKEYE